MPFIAVNCGYKDNLCYIISCVQTTNTPINPYSWQFFHVYLKIYVSEGGKYQELVKNILLYNKSFKIQDGCQFWPIESVNTTSV